VYTIKVPRPQKRIDTRTNAALRAITYGRVSTGRQAASGISLDDQAEKLADVVAARGWVHIAHLTDPGLSGRKMTNRKGLLDAIARLDRHEADVLVAAKIDRVSRSTTDFARLLDQAERKGWKLVVLDADVDTTTAAGRLLVDVVSAAASFESRRIGERAKSVHAVRRSQGKRAGPAPLLPDTVRFRIASDRATGKTLNAIASALNDEGVPTAKGGHWYASTVAHVLRSVGVDQELARVRAGVIE
jgi:DNA invertase Pin-like site-specific DNA recombinase